MGELPPNLYDRCRSLLSNCDEFESNEAVQSILVGTEFKEYARYIKEKQKVDDRISECIRALQNRSYNGKPVLALFLETLGKRYPDGDDTRAQLQSLARDIRLSDIPFLSSVSLVSASQNTQRIAEEDTSVRVLVIWDRNEAARIEICEFLRGANLVPVEWKQIEATINKSGPSVEEIFSTAFHNVQAVILVFTGDDLVELRGEFVDNVNPRRAQASQHQPGPEQLFKAGVAFAMQPTRTILVALGNVRPFHSLLERHLIRLTNSDEDREGVIAKLKLAHCTVTGYEWAVKGNFQNPAFY